MARSTDKASGEMREVAVGRTAEARLIEAARRGQRAAYDRLVRCHLAGAYALACRLVGAPDDAEDVVQEAFLKAHEALATFAGGSSFRTWVHRIVVNAAFDHLRRRKRSRVRLARENELEASAAPHQEVDSRARGAELAGALNEALEDLPPRMRTALVLRVIQGHAYEEVAAVLGATPTTCRVYVSQARSRLMRSLGHLLDE